MTDYALPNPGRNRFWYGTHAPNSVKTPLTLELREKMTESAAPIRSLSKLIAKQGTIADPKAVHEAAHEILARASDVDTFTGVLTGMTVPDEVGQRRERGNAA